MADCQVITVSAHNMLPELLALRDLLALLLAAAVTVLVGWVLLKLLPGVAPFFLQAAEYFATGMRRWF